MGFWDLFRAKIEEEEPEISIPGADLRCENAIIRDKARFGRVRMAMMRLLREKYGENTANRARWRVNSRLSKSYLLGDDRVEAEEKAMRPASRLRPIAELVDEQKDKAKDYL